MSKVDEKIDEVLNRYKFDSPQKKAKFRAQVKEMLAKYQDSYGLDPFEILECEELYIDIDFLCFLQMKDGEANSNIMIDEDWLRQRRKPEALSSSEKAYIEEYYENLTEGRKPKDKIKILKAYGKDAIEDGELLEEIADDKKIKAALLKVLEVAAAVGIAVGVLGSLSNMGTAEPITEISREVYMEATRTAFKYLGVAISSLALFQLLSRPRDKAKTNKVETRHEVELKIYECKHIAKLLEQAKKELKEQIDAENERARQKAAAKRVADMMELFRREYIDTGIMENTHKNDQSNDTSTL